MKCVALIRTGRITIAVALSDIVECTLTFLGSNCKPEDNIKPEVSRRNNSVPYTAKLSFIKNFTATMKELQPLLHKQNKTKRRN